MEYNITIGAGDGIGPEVMEQAIKVLNKVGEKFDHRFNYEKVFVGGASIDEFGVPLHSSQMEKILNSDALLFGSIGGPKWDDIDPEKRPEKGLLALRKELGTFANLRPVKVFDDLSSASTIKEEFVKGVDLLVVRELTGGIYFGKHETLKQEENQEVFAIDEMKYSESEIKRIAKVAFEIARKRNKKVCSVDKANVLDVSKLWRKTVIEVAKEYPDVELSHMYVDNAAMQLILNPKQFDVILTGNMFGDIISDAASVLGGSLGMLASASVGQKDAVAMYEPSGGSAPDIAGKNIANPIAQIISASMMLELSFGLKDEAKAIMDSINKVLTKYRTGDIYEDGKEKVSCSEMGDLIAENI